MDISHYLLILVGAALVNNVVLVRILGLCPFLGVSQKSEAALGMGMATAFVLTLAAGSSYWVNQLLVAWDVPYLRTLSFIVVIVAIVQFSEVVVHNTSPVQYQVLGIYLPLITTNCAVLGIPLLSVQNHHSFADALVFGFGSAVGFSLVLLLFAAIRERLEGADVPTPFKGTPIALVTAGLMSLALLGFGGMVL